MAIFWGAVGLCGALVLLFTAGMTTALEFLGAFSLPIVAIGGTKRSIIQGSTAQRIGGPIIGMLIFALAYWLAGDLSIRIFGHVYGGHTLAIVSAILGLTVPLAAAHAPSTPEHDLDSSRPSSIPQGQDSRTISDGPRGSITFAPGEKAAIRLSEEANTSTTIYLLAMHMLDQLVRDAAHEHAPDDLKRDVKIVFEWLGLSEDHEIPNAGYERFGRGFESFLMEHPANLGSASEAFDKLGKSLSAIYQIGDELHPPIDDEVRGVFRRLFVPP